MKTNQMSSQSRRKRHVVDHSDDDEPMDIGKFRNGLPWLLTTLLVTFKIQG